MATSYPRTTSQDFLKVCLRPTADFYNYWDSKRLGRAMPARADLDPINMRPWLPGIILVDVLYNPFRLIYRLVGTRSVDLRHGDVTGRLVEDGRHGDKLGHVMENYRLVVEERTLVYDWDGTEGHDGLVHFTEVLMLPLSADGRSVDMVVSYIDHRPDARPNFPTAR